MNSLLTLISVILNVILNIPLIISYGAFGAAIATSMAGLISGLISLCVAQYYFKINYEWEKIIWILLIFFSGSIISIILYMFNFLNFWSVFIKVSIMFIYVILGVAYKIISKRNYNNLILSFKT